FDPDGPGPTSPALFAGGENLNYPHDFAASWDGSSWTDLDYPSGSIIEEFCEFGGELYAGGHYPPLVNSATLARWLGGNSWEYVWFLDVGSTIKSMAVWNSGVALGGLFPYDVNGVSSDNVLLWSPFNEMALQPGWPCPIAPCDSDDYVRAVCV